MAVYASCIVTVLLAAVLPMHHSFPAPGSSDFSSNFLKNFGNSSFQLEGSSIVQLPNGDGYIITGAVTSPSGFVLPSVSDAPDVKQANTTARMGLVLRISTSGKVVWSKRTCALPKGVSLSAAVSPGGAIFIAGARLGVKQEWHLVLARYAVNGTLEFFRSGRGTRPGLAYSAVLASGNDSVILVADVGASRVTPPGNATTTRRSVGVLLLAQGNGSTLQSAVLTRTANASVKFERPWAAALSADRATLYVLVRRSQVIRNSYTKTETVYALRTAALAAPPLARVDLDYGRGTRPQLGLAGGALLVAQVINAGATRRLRVTRLDVRTLAPANWRGSSTHVRERDISHPASAQTRAENTLARVLGAAPRARVVLSAQTELDEDDEEQGNLRPSVIELEENGTIAAAEAADTARTVIAADAVAVGRDTVVLGTDTTDQNAPRLYLAIAGGPGQKTEERATGNTTKTTAACIGTKTTVHGLSIFDEVRRRRMRKQIHPVKLVRTALGFEDRRVRVLCFSKKGSRVCATPGHILYVDGEARYMHEVCESMFCESEIQEVMNFKSGCGSHIDLYEGLSISMHSGSKDEIETGKRAVEVVKDECSEQKNNWIRWVMSTL